MTEQPIGIPYARVSADNGRWFATCPICDKRILLFEWKDFESPTKREYADHYAKEHAADANNLPS